MKNSIRFVAAFAVLALSACNPAPSADCVKYLACTEAVSPGSAAALKGAYDTGGTCWTTGTATADTCTAACKAAVASLASSSPNTAACK
ncbi:MAG: hypothetical protein Q8L48_29265 [Archangium sp.]|nr:hypothetical protein [Archangium sp.]